MKPVFCFVLLLSIASCGKYNVKHYGCDDPPVNEKFNGGYVFMPNIITPNGDGLNDLLYIMYKGASNISIKIKTPIGGTVFERSNLETIATGEGINVWDGTVKGKNGSDNNYHYELSFTTPAGEQKTFKGRITAINDDPMYKYNYMNLACIKNISSCVFGDQWISDTTALIPVTSSNDYYHYGSCK